MGTSWSRSRDQIVDGNGKPYPGAKVFFFNASTTTPRTVFQDASLSTPHTHPVIADVTGRFPRVFLPYGDYRERVVTSADVQLWDDDGLSNDAPVTNTGGAVDPIKLKSTGDIEWRLQSGTLPGRVRLNRRTIGSAASGASERANADTEALFSYLWNNVDNSIATVVGGRGASAAADWAANKQITLPSMQGRSPMGLDAMGGASSGLFAGSSFTSGIDTAGAIGGASSHTLTIAEQAAHNHTASVNDPGHAHTVVQGGGSLSAAGPGGNTAAATGSQGTTASLTGISVTISSSGGGGAHNNLHPVMLGTFYIWL